MKPVPETQETLVLRTDFSDEAAWNALRTAIERPSSIFQAYVEFLSDPDYDGLSTEQILALVPPRSNRSFLFIVDQVTISHPEHPVLVVDLYRERGRAFRVIASQLYEVESNLSIANRDFEDYLQLVDDNGIYRMVGGSSQAADFLMIRETIKRFFPGFFRD